MLLEKNQSFDLMLANQTEAAFVKRLNRFVAQVELAEGIVLAHVPNSGRMGELLVPGAQILVEKSNQLDRITSCTLSLVKFEDKWVSIDSRLPNKLFEAGLKRNFWPGFHPQGHWRREVIWGESRFDGLFEEEGKRTWIEVKSVTLVEQEIARFPDAPTGRGLKHIKHLCDLVKQGEQAKIIFIIQRDDAVSFSPNWRTDPAFAQELQKSQVTGVDVVAATCFICPQGIRLVQMIPVSLVDAAK